MQPNTGIYVTEPHNKWIGFWANWEKVNSLAQPRSQASSVFVAYEIQHNQTMTVAEA